MQGSRATVLGDALGYQPYAFRCPEAAFGDMPVSTQTSDSVKSPLIFGITYHATRKAAI